MSMNPAQTIVVLLLSELCRWMYPLVFSAEELLP